MKLALPIFMIHPSYVEGGNESGSVGSALSIQKGKNIEGFQVKRGLEGSFYVNVIFIFLLLCARAVIFSGFVWKWALTTLTPR